MIAKALSILFIVIVGNFYREGATILGHIGVGMFATSALVLMSSLVGDSE